MKKIFLILMLTLVIFNPKEIKAYHLTKDDYDNIYFVVNGGSEYYMSDKQFKFTLDGTIAYCLNPKLQVKTYNYNESSLDNSNYDEETKEYLKKVIYYGYDYPNHQTIRYYMATQALIWEKLYGYLIEFYTKQYGYGNYISVQNEKNEILSLVNQRERGNSLTFGNERYGHVKILQYQDDIFKDYEIIDSNYENAYINNNTLVIDKLDEFRGQINIELRKKEYRNDTVRYYFAPSSQPLITGGRLNQDINLSLDINWANLKIVKTDKESKQPVKGEFVFNIYNKDLKEYVYVDGNKDIKTDENGIISLEHLPYGTYEIKEVKTINGYKLNKEIKEVILNEDKKIFFENEREKGKIEITKYGEEFDDSKYKYKFKPLKDIEFEIYALDDIITLDGVKRFSKDELILTKKTDENGKIIFDNLELGTYDIKEKTPKVYIENNEVYTFDLNKEKEIKKDIYNHLKKTNLKIVKIDSESKLPIKKEGFVFNIRNKETNEYIVIDGNKDLTTNNEGIINIENLPYGTYEIIEVKTIKGYKLNKEVKETILDEEIKEIFFENEREKGKIEITKYGEKFKTKEYYFEPLKDIEFELYAMEDIVTLEGIKHFSKDELILTKKTDENGNIIFDDLELGTYYIKEKTPKIYMDNNDVYIFDLKNGKEQSKDIYNYLKKKSLIIKKIDYITEEPLSGTLFEIFYNDELLGEYKTDVNGFIEINNLPISTYKIKEIKSHDGYYLLDDEIFVNLDIENEITIKNKKQIIIPNAMKNNYQKGILLIFILIGCVLFEIIKNKQNI